MTKQEKLLEEMRVAIEALRADVEWLQRQIDALKARKSR